MNAKRLFTIVTILTLAIGMLEAALPTTASPNTISPLSAARPESEGSSKNDATGGSVSLPEGVPSAWWTQAQQEIAQSEYEISWAEQTYLPELAAAYQAPNRAQDLRTYFTPQGIWVISRTETPPAWQLGLTLSGYGLDGEIQPAGEANLQPQANRIDFQRPGIAEWYLNDEAGLQQGFLIRDIPGSDQAAHILLEIAIQGTLAASLSTDGMRVEFKDQEGRQVLAYANLAVTDRQDAVYPFQMELRRAEESGGQILRLILPSAAGGLTLTARLVSAGGEANDPENLSTAPNWWHQGGAPSDVLGAAVSSAGDIDGDGYDDIIVGAYGFDSSGADRGKVFVWKGSPDGLCLGGISPCAPAWTAEGKSAGDWFGWSVGSAGDVNNDGFSDIIVGARYYHVHQASEGAVYAWYGSVGGLGDPLEADWMYSSSKYASDLGYSVGTAGDVNGDGCDDIIVGTPYYDDTLNDQGGAFVWYGATGGLDTNGYDWWAFGDHINDWFGVSVSTAGDVNGDGYADIIVGANYYDNVQADEGAAYVWHGSVSGLGGPDRTPDWLVQTDRANTEFGWSVSTAGDVNGDGFSDVLIGARHYDNSHTDEGAVLVWYGAGAGLGPANDTLATADWQAESNQTSATLGWSVSTAGDLNGDGYADIIAGAAHYDNGQADEGQILVWYGSASGLGYRYRSPDWAAEVNQGTGRLGWSVSAAGDVNGDGFADILAGAPQTDSPYGDAGQAYVWYGSSGGPALSLAWKYKNLSSTAYDSIGSAVGTAGDVNADGYSDVIVGAYGFDSNGANRGKVFVWYGSEDGLCPSGVPPCEPAWTAEGEYAGDEFGYSVGTAGDLNGDGYADIVVGARFYHVHQSWEGAVYVWYGSADGLDTDGHNWMYYSNKYQTDFGESVGTAGDVNGDGYDDLIVGTHGYENTIFDQGGVFVWYGSPSGLDTDGYDWYALGDHQQDYFGISIGTAGDVNGDGYADIILGANYYDNGEADEGAVYVWHGAAYPTNLGENDRLPDWLVQSNRPNSEFGWSVGTAGDVNGDGFSDVLIGARHYDNGEGDEGAVFVWYGSIIGLGPANDNLTTADWRAESNQTSATLGWSAGAAGDVNGDGFADILAGAAHYDQGGEHTNEGCMALWYGSADGLVGEQDTLAEADWLYEANYVDDRLGWSVGTAGDVNGDGYSDIIAGAYGADRVGANDVGEVYVFYGSAHRLSGNATLKIESTQAGAELGFSVGTAGDINGDGFTDIIIGAPYYDSGQSSEGRAFVYRGSASGIITTTIWMAESNVENANFGSAVGTAGDVNGDGYSDILVGAPYYSHGSNNEGAAFAWYGSDTGLGSNGNPVPPYVDWVAEGEQALAYMGNALGAAGDINGDGFADIVVGARGYDHDQVNEGRVDVYLGSASGLSSSVAWTAEGDQANAEFGYAVGGAGDVNGDGFSDLIVGANKFDRGQTDEGQVYVYLGTSTGLASTPAWTAESDQAGAKLGHAVGTAGDVNGDGFSDVIVGALAYEQGGTYQDWYEGAAFVWYGSLSGLGVPGTPQNAGWITEGNRRNAQYGTAVGTAGDVNGDGYSDVIVGAPYFNNGPAEEGRAFVYTGSAAGLTLTPQWTAEANQGSALFGSSVGTAGDVDGDGFADVIVGAPLYDHAGTPTVTDAGLVCLYHGNGGNDLGLLPRQLRSDGIPVSPLGLSDSLSSVHLGLTGLMPLGRQKVKLQWQIAPLGTFFTDPTAITGSSDSWTDTGLEGVVFVAKVSGLTPGTPYHWRIRLLYWPGNRLGQPASRWITIPWNGWQELDFRTPPMPEDLRQIYLPMIKK